MDKKFRNKLTIPSLNSVVDDLDLEAQKRREYEEWFRLQEKEALEYSACVKYQEKEKAEERTQTLIDVTDFSTSQQITSNIQSSTEQSNSGMSVVLSLVLESQ